MEDRVAEIKGCVSKMEDDVSEIGDCASEMQDGVSEMEDCVSEMQDCVSEMEDCVSGMEDCVAETPKSEPGIRKSHTWLGFRVQDLRFVVYGLGLGSPVSRRFQPIPSRGFKP